VIDGTTVAVSRNENLGAAAGGLTLIGGTLRTTASIVTDRAIQLGSGGGTLAIAQGTSITLDGVISGGALTVNGGFVFLNGANTHAGGTTVNGGAVFIRNNAALGSGSLTLNGGRLLNGSSFATDRAIMLGSGGGTLSVQAGTTLTSLGIIAGTSLAVDGGELVLNGTSTYSGGTTLYTDSTITVGNDQALGTGALTMAAGSTLNVGTNVARPASADAVVLANNIVTTGVVATRPVAVLPPNGNTQSLVLTGSCCFSGQIVGPGSDVGATTAGAATINTGAGLTLFVNGVVSGDGRINKTGAGLLVLAGQNSLAGGVTVAAGTLNVTGAMASGVTVAAGALLAGTGRIGSLNVQAGGTVNPGAPASADVATLTVTGAVFLAGTTMVNLTPTTHDSITAVGAMTVGGTLALVPAAGTPLIQFNQSFTVASGASLTGTFATVTGLEGSAFTPTVTYTATGASVRLAPQSLVALGNGFGTLREAAFDALGNRVGGLSGNALEVAMAFDRAVATGYNPQSFFNVYASSGSALTTTLRQMSGEQRAAERRVVLESGRAVRESALDRLNAGTASLGGQQVRSSDGDRVLTMWLRGAGSWGTSSGGTAQASGAATGFTAEQRGVLTGLDWAKDGLTVGGMFHFTTTDIEYRVFAGRSTVETVGGTVYGGYRRDGGVVVNGGISIAGARTSGSRAITLPGFAQTLAGATTGSSWQVFGEAGYDLAASATTRIEPFARLAHVKADIGALTETGGVAALAAGKQGHAITVINLGGRLGANIAKGKVALNAGASWQATSGDRDAATIIGIPAVGQNGLIRTVQIDSSALSLQADAGVDLAQTIRFSLGYSGLIGKRNNDHGGRATLSVAF
jgi:autotransporter-associated beta strand protein